MGFPAAVPGSLRMVPSVFFNSRLQKVQTKTYRFLHDHDLLEYAMPEGKWKPGPGSVVGNAGLWPAEYRRDVTQPVRVEGIIDDPDQLRKFMEKELMEQRLLENRKTHDAAAANQHTSQEHATPVSRWDTKK